MIVLVLYSVISNSTHFNSIGRDVIAMNDGRPFGDVGGQLLGQRFGGGTHDLSTGRFYFCLCVRHVQGNVDGLAELGRDFWCGALGGEHGVPVVGIHALEAQFIERGDVR